MAGINLSWRWWRPLLSTAGGALLFSGAHVLSDHPLAGVLRGVGVALLVALLALVLWQRRRAPWSERLTEGLPALLFLFSALCYLSSRFIRENSATGSHWAELLGWGWALALLLGFFPFLLMELSLWSQGYPSQPARPRLLRALEAGATLALLLALVATLNFVFVKLNWQWDSTYFHTARPSLATVEVAESLAEPVEVGLFYPENDTAGAIVSTYLSAFPEQVVQLQISRHDAELNPVIADSFKARRNGLVVLRKGKQHKKIRVGLGSSRKTRQKLKTFDSSFFTALLELGQASRLAYMSIGHRERQDREYHERTTRHTVEELKAVLRERNFIIKDLALAQGIKGEVPEDAALLIVIAPEARFLPGELDAFKGYLERGGRMMVFMDPDVPAPQGQASRPLVDFLANYGLKFIPLPQRHDRYYARHTHTKADKGFLVTSAYEKFSVFKALASPSKRLPLLLLGAGALKAEKTPPDFTLRAAIKAMPGTWGDENGNFTFDKGQDRRRQSVFSLVLQERKPKKPAEDTEKKSGARMLVFSDADMVSDFLMRNFGNRRVIAEGISWLTSENPISGVPRSGKDVKIVHAKGDEWLWFYLPVAGVPLLVLGLGLWCSGWMTRWRRA